MFSEEFDRSLWLMLVSDKNNREDIVNFCSIKGFSVSDMEIDIIYNFIQKNYNDLLNKNDKILLELKCKLTPTLYNKIIILYNTYKIYI